MKERTTSKESTKGISDMAEKALRNYEHAVRTGLKMQEEAVQAWTNLFSQSATQDYQKGFTRFNTVANAIMPAAQKRMEETLDLMEQNSQTGAKLMKKAMDAAQTPVIAESQAKWMDFWSTSLEAARCNAEAFTQIGTRAM